MIELVERKDIGNPKFDDHGGKRCGLLLQMLSNYFETGRYVVLNSRFCVLIGIVELKKEGIFAGALI